MASRQVIVVDDEPMILETLLLTLEEWATARGVSLVACSSPRAGLEALADGGEEVHVFVSDLKMPEMKGSELLRLVKERSPHTITILMTGYPEVQEIANAVGAGIFSFILKPWQPLHLESEMDKALQVHDLQEQTRRHAARLEDELRWGGQLQRAMLELSLPASSLVSFSAVYVPLEHLHCGGDYYDVIPLPDERYLCLIGDVAGHGIKAAFVTTVLKALTHERFAGGEDRGDPARLLGWLNQRVCSIFGGLPEMLITFGACLLDAQQLTLTHADAGHLPLMVVRGGRLLKLNTPGRGLGFAPDADYEQASFGLERDDRIVFYTDGLVELDRGQSGGEERLELALTAELHAPDYCASVVERIRGQAPGGFADDVALLVARIL